MTLACEPGKLIEVAGTLSLIGGPLNGRVVESPASGSWLEVDGNRYVVRRNVTAGGPGTREDVGIFLPLYARVLAARRGGRASWPRRSL
jgi:hypothetical protein